MIDFAPFEVHLHDGFEFGPTDSAPLFSKGVGTLVDADDESHDDYNAELGAELDADESNEFDEADDAELGGHPGLGFLVGLILLVSIAAVVCYICGGDDDLDELTDLNDADDEERDEVEADT